MTASDADRALYLSVSELSRRYQATDGLHRTGALTEFELRCFSQNGEDGVIGEVLARVGKTTPFFVEFGSDRGVQGNCLFLADVLGWEGLFIEANPPRYRSLARKYASQGRVTTMNAMVTPETIEQLFDRADVPQEFAVLSIDVDGQDYWIWQALERYRPCLVVIEYNAALPPDRELVQPLGYPVGWDGSDYFGASLAALCALAARKNYQLVHTELAAVNAFFVRADLATDCFPAEGEVPRRLEPNYYLRGLRHASDLLRRPYTDVSAGEDVVLADEPGSNSSVQ